LTSLSVILLSPHSLTSDNNNCIEKQESPWVKVGDKQLKNKKKKRKHREAKKSPQHTAAESEENLPQISEETQTVMQFVRLTMYKGYQKRYILGQ
jgi:beta-N-acetylglucosaminidase